MNHDDQLSTGSHGAQVARIVWSSRILSYLAKDRNLSGSRLATVADVPAVEQVADNDSVLEHENDGEDQDFYDIRSFTGSERTALLSGPQDRISKKLLDCIAQLLSARHGWGHVTATALETYEDSVKIFVARNDCFAKDDAAACDLCASMRAEPEGCTFLSK
jgi:hypothetical protein